MLEIRPVETDAERALVLGIHNLVHPDDALALADVQSYIAQTDAYVDYLAWLDGEVAGGAHAALPHEWPEAHGEVFVPPDRRRRGIGTALYGAISEWVRDHGHDALVVRVGESDREGIDFATNRGFVEIGRDLRVVLDFRRTTPPRAEPPEGIAIKPWAECPEATRGIYAAAIEGSQDIPGNEELVVPSFEQWFDDHMSGSGDRPEATFVALHGNEVVGFAKFSLTDAQPTTAHHDLTAVKRAWRNRGIARALKSAQIEWARRQGYERLITGNEERNAPIRKLNAEFGYEPYETQIRMRGPLSDVT